MFKNHKIGIGFTAILLLATLSAPVFAAQSSVHAGDNSAPRGRVTIGEVRVLPVASMARSTAAHGRVVIGQVRVIPLASTPGSR